MLPVTILSNLLSIHSMKKNMHVFYNSIVLLFFVNTFTALQAQNIYLVDATHTGITTATPVNTVNTTAWNNATGNLQTAINNASVNGGQVWVKTATYKPVDYPNGCSNCSNARDKAFLLLNNVALYGGFAGSETLLSQRNAGNNPTILSGDLGIVNDNNDNCYHTIISINTSSATIIDGFIISGGNANGAGAINVSGQNSRRNTGGGILNDSLSSPAISNCTFSNGGSISNIYKCLPGITDCRFDGIGILNDSFSHSTITNCSFANVSSTCISNNLSNPSITNCNFANNSRGISNDLSNPIVSGCFFTNNSSGGIVNGDFTQPTITNCNFTNANITNGTYSTPHINKCVFSGNNTALYNTRSSPIITNCAFANNVTGIYNLAASSPNVTNCIFVNNSSYGVYNDYQCGPGITNCTFTNNGSYSIYYSSGAFSNTRISNCVIWGNGSGNTAPGIFYYAYGNPAPNVINSIVQGGYSGSGNQNTDPVYVNASIPAGADGVFGNADDGLQLAPCSPAINSGNNTAIANTITDMIGATRVFNSIVDMGAYEFQGLPGLINLSTNSNNATVAVSLTNNTHFINNCQLISSLVSSGANPVNGNTTARLWVEAAQLNYNGQVFLKRHYEIIPATNAATATAKITIYATQPEFDAFNNNGTKGNLPASPVDTIGIEQLRIIKFGGQSNNGTGMPSSYTQPAMELNPADNNIIWNTMLQRWEISFDVTGFGGFFISNANSSILPLTLLNFSGRVITFNNAMLNWRTANELNTGYFELQRSADLFHFTTITKVNAKGASDRETDYSYADDGLQAGMYYYRLRMKDKDGKKAYSAVVKLHFKAQNTMSLYPVPARDVVWLSGNTANPIGSNAMLMDAQGRILQTIRITQWPQPVNITALQAGNYLIKLPGETAIKLMKQ